MEPTEQVALWQILGPEGWTNEEASWIEWRRKQGYQVRALFDRPEPTAVLQEVRSHFIVDYGEDGRIAGVAHDSEALRKVVTILDAAIRATPVSEREEGR